MPWWVWHGRKFFDTVLYRTNLFFKNIFVATMKLCDRIHWTHSGFCFHTGTLLGSTQQRPVHTIHSWSALALTIWGEIGRGKYLLEARWLDSGIVTKLLLFLLDWKHANLICY